MALTKRKSKKQDVIVETETNLVKTNEVKNIEPKTIKKGSKVVVNGRLFGSANLEAPMNSVRNYETKILEVTDKSYRIDLGYISKDSIKD